MITNTGLQIQEYYITALLDYWITNANTNTKYHDINAWICQNTVLLDYCITNTGLQILDYKYCITNTGLLILYYKYFITNNELMDYWITNADTNIKYYDINAWICQNTEF